MKREAFRMLFPVLASLSVVVVFLLGAETLIALTSREIQKQYHKSYNYEKLQDYENAVKTLAPVFQKYPKGYTVNIRLGWLYYLKKNYANSIHHYQVAIAAAPYSIEAKLGYSLPLMAQKKYEPLESLLYQILSADQNNYYANLKLTIILRLQKKLDLAEKISKAMLVLYPINISFLSELALIKLAKGEKEDAAWLFQDILTLDPENTVAKAFLKNLKQK